jgi:hypothetical protein
MNQEGTKIIKMPLAQTGFLFTAKEKVAQISAIQQPSLTKLAVATCVVCCQ